LLWLELQQLTGIYGPAVLSTSYPAGINHRFIHYEFHISEWREKKFPVKLELCMAITLQSHNTENSKKIFPEKELRGHNPNFHIHVSIGDLYIPTLGLPILLQENMWTAILGIYKSITDT
jgi:hypothetical protein